MKKALCCNVLSLNAGETEPISEKKGISLAFKSVKPLVAHSRIVACPGKSYAQEFYRGVLCSRNCRVQFHHCLSQKLRLKEFRSIPETFSTVETQSQKNQNVPYLGHVLFCTLHLKHLGEVLAHACCFHFQQFAPKWRIFIFLREAMLACFALFWRTLSQFLLLHIIMDHCPRPNLHFEIDASRHS